MTREQALRYIADKMDISRADVKKITNTHVITLNWRKVPHGLEYAGD